MTKQWLWMAATADVEAAAKAWRVPPLVAQLLVNRGHAADQPIDDFLVPQLKDLHPPALLPGVQGAAAILVDFVRRKERITLYGDYDVDGIMGIAVLWHVLRATGADVQFYVPHRIEEGYGLNAESVRRLIDEGTRLIVSVDCGIGSHDVAQQVRDAGATLIVTDHHTIKDSLPSAAAVVHPGLGDYPNRGLCGAGVAFKLAWSVAQQISGTDRVSSEFRELLMELLPLTALGTIADVVSLHGENRIFARHGLDRLPKSKIPGIRALLETTGLTRGNLSTEDVGFKLAPRINAAGRMGHARLAVELFTRADLVHAHEIALYLDDHNRARQVAERKAAAEACEVVEKTRLAGDARRAIVLASSEWHAGILGIAAARLVEKYHRPTAMIALSNGEGQGSARSVRHFDLSKALAECGEHLLQFGGHAMAAGFRIAADRVAAFTDAFVAAANRALTGDDLLPKLRLDAAATIGELTLPIVETIHQLGPFGLGNPRPKFATGWVELADEPRSVGRNSEHLQAQFSENGRRMKGIGFGLGGLLQDLKQHRRCRVAFEPIINDYQGRRTVEMQIVDLQFPDS